MYFVILLYSLDAFLLCIVMCIIVLGFIKLRLIV
jgi:hypothetical protein